MATYNHGKMDKTNHGFLILDKPLGMTSRAAVDCCAQWFPRRMRLGHTGTLDPLATGVLVVAVGQGTRLTDYVQGMTKTYRAGIRLGARSDTDDGEGNITADEGAGPLPLAEVQGALSSFVGVIAQVPPAFSAAKLEGRRAYDLARRGAEVDLAARPVRIDVIELVRYDYPDLSIDVHCGKGTYIRSLARDLGERLGCGAYLTSLRRTSIGPFHESAALPLNVDPDVGRRSLLDLSFALGDLPRVTVTAADAERLVHGQALAWAGAEASGEVAIFDAAGALVGAGEIEEHQRLRPKKMFWRNPAQA
jgi:tRNA pseudouridine55 synthase